ncbi:hypothetical protein [Terrimonas alba]|uniref:hypothetical protein n=1 Tax=Terrimonas alba TaxID=3349636 RepID=UPI0035F25D11
MKKSIMILMMVTTGFFCSGQSSTDSVYTGTVDSTKNVQSQKLSANHNGNNFHTKYEYPGSNGARLIIQNSFPKSGVNYTDPNGKKYVYAVFWTQIINETFDPLELTIDFPLDSLEIPSSSGNYMKLLLPSDTMTIHKEPLYDYGLTIKSFLDNNRYKSSSLKRTINPKGSSTFYVVTLSNRGVDGTIRTGLSLKEQNLFYRINDKEIHCGKINLKSLVLKK